MPGHIKNDPVIELTKESKKALAEWFSSKLEDPEWVRENRAFLDKLIVKCKPLK